MKSNLEKTEQHEHKGPQCKTTDAICHEPACQHDHHVSSHMEVSCTPIEGKHDLYKCIHR